MGDELVPANSGEFLFYQTEDGQTQIEVRVVGETVWLSQRVMAELFQKDVRTISEHIRNIFDEGELQAESVIRNFRITAGDGKQYGNGSRMSRSGEVGGGQVRYSAGGPATYRDGLDIGAFRTLSLPHGSLPVHVLFRQSSDWPSNGASQ